MIERALILTAAALLLSAVMTACADEPKPLAPGRCNINEDCPQSERCIQGFCEDIYHPRREIKNY